MKRLSLYFVSPKQVAVREESVLTPAAGQVLVESVISAISPGTEMLVYRGQVPDDMPVDETIADLAGKFDFPLKYGYSVVGQVIETGSGISREWQNRLVFAFHPHESHFLTTPDNLVMLPPSMSKEDAVFLPNMETSINLIMDGQPLIGEQVVIFGQGIVGLLTTALLAQFPLSSLITVDGYPMRRKFSLGLGAHTSLDSQASNALQELQQRLQESQHYAGADLSFELSGNPAALDQALAVTGFDGRIIIGSWYGQKRADLNLGGKFHRKRIRLISSQVSTIAPELRGRWTKQRRMQLALQMVHKVQPARFITQRFHINQAAEAYEERDQHAEEAIQIVFSY